MFVLVLLHPVEAARFHIMLSRGPDEAEAQHKGLHPSLTSNRGRSGRNYESRGDQESVDFED